MVYTNEEGVPCTCCAYRHTRPGEAFGHTRCSVHRLCTGFIYWEPSNCKHCTNFEISLKDLDPNSRYALMGKLKGLLDKVQEKVRESNPHRDWQYIPIYNWVFTKFNISQPEQDEHTNSPHYDGSSIAGPSDQSLQQANNEVQEYDYDTRSDSDSIAEDGSGLDTNNLLSDYCSTLYCITGDPAQCTDEVHRVQEHLSQRTNTPVLEEARRKRPLSPAVRVGNVPSYGTSNPMLDREHDQPQEV